MGEDDLAEVAQDMQMQDVQSYANMAIGNYPPPPGQLAPFGYSMDPASLAAAKEHARVQQSAFVLEQAAAIRADKPLMQAIRKYLRDERDRVSRLLAEID